MGEGVVTKSGFAFQPAPRPTPRVTSEEAQALQEATKDLGFGRPTAAPQEPATATDVRASPKAPAPRPNKPAKPQPKLEAEVAKRGPALKFDVPDEVWDSLRMEAVRRRVTVKYLVLEALAAKGYEVDLAAIPEDGRRIR